MRTESYWFHRYPDGFHCDTAGCMLPLLSVARDRIRYDCGLVALSSNSNRRHVKRACSPVNRAGCQVAPLSIDTSTLAMSFSPAQAKPPIGTLPAANDAPFAGVVT